MPFLNDKMVLLSGGPGAGKTTTLHLLQSCGYTIEEEAARRIIQEQIAQGGDALPWGNRQAYTDLMLERSIASYRRHQETTQPVFFDRGIPDSLGYARLIGLEDSRALELACKDYRYAGIVFMAPPWPEIYVTDNERKQDIEEAKRTYALLYALYLELGYQVIELPLCKPQERVSFLLAELGLPCPAEPEA